MRLPLSCILLSLLTLLSISSAEPATKADAFDALRQANWQPVFNDDCATDWRRQWFLDGIHAKVTNGNQRMTIDTSDGYAVLWTKPEFAGDLKIEYDFRRVDDKNWGVNIIYVQARGDGQDGHLPDITKWSDRRSLAAMKNYFLNMHAYHVSYAAYPTKGDDVTDYVRARRYLPLANDGMRNTKLNNEYLDTGLFADKQWVHVTLIKRDKQLWMEFKHPDKTLLCHFVNDDKPPVRAGRVGLRLMPGRLSEFKNFRISQSAAKPPPAWHCHIIQRDPQDHGPDGINLHDWDADGNLDVFVNYEEGKYSRLYLNPGYANIHQPWPDFVQFNHGKCEDSGIGDLDNDGNVDYVANGGWIYFNPGAKKLRDPAAWTKMTLFNNEQRVPTVADLDGDGLNDLIVGAQTWYKQPATDKHNPDNWQAFTISKAVWPMNCHLHDVDRDGDPDLVVPDRRRELLWFENPGPEAIAKPWPRHQLHPYKGAMFMAVGDVNQDGLDDYAVACGYEGQAPYVRNVLVLLRTNKSGPPQFTEVIIPQAAGNFPKGVQILDLDNDPTQLEIIVNPKQGDLWMASFAGDPANAANWTTSPLGTQDPESRKKMDNLYPGDLDGDGQLEFLTTEENGAWGVIWFDPDDSLQQ